MTAALLDGKKVASFYKTAIQQETNVIIQQGHPPPGLAVILLGEDPASRIYVTNKRKACADVGFQSYAYDLPSATSEKELLLLIDKLNNAPEVHGILIQLPLPPHIHTPTVLERILPNKDVDGFHPYNLGRLAQANPLLRPCTPLGVMKLLDYYDLEVKGKHAVVVGASNIVGRPMALELLLAKATVTVCHRQTQSLKSHILAADIIVVATGVCDVIDPNWLKKNHILLDIGIHRQTNGSLRGDIDFDKAKDKVAWITPVPGGVGPMTIIALLYNTLWAVTHCK